jgi:spore coat polysaccharide biosynthesis protein SpsF
MTSTRLPGKILVDLAGRPMLARQLRRLRACRFLDDIVVATTTNSTDDPVVELARAEGVRYYRGDEHDVLSRYVDAARDAAADVVVRITADCPLIDPGVADLVIARGCDLDDPCDYASNTLRRTYPRGLDTEVLSVDVLNRIGRMARSAAAREHVTYFAHRERPELFVLREVIDSEDHSDLRWTVDTPDDLELVRRIYERMGLAECDVPYRDLVTRVAADPTLSTLNKHVEQKKT